jgi:hypothetical protein
MHRKSLWHEKPLATLLLNIDTVCGPETAVASPGTRLVCDSVRSLQGPCDVALWRASMLRHVEEAYP